MKKKLVVLSGAGMSAESGIQTFRDADGLWEGHDVMDVATPEGFRRNPGLVLDFYNQRRRQLLAVQPNLGHVLLAALEAEFDVTVITQNVDDLHERAGSSRVVHLHGELLKVQSTINSHHVLDWTTDLLVGDVGADGHPLRPHIVWFGEEVPALDYAVTVVAQADYLVVIGTSLQVYPAAGLLHAAPLGCLIFYIDPKPASLPNLSHTVEVIERTASEGLSLLRAKLLELNES